MSYARSAQELEGTKGKYLETEGACTKPVGLGPVILFSEHKTLLLPKKLLWQIHTVYLVRGFFFSAVHVLCQVYYA